MLSDSTFALVVGTLLAILALSLVLAPLIGNAAVDVKPAPAPAPDEAERSDSAIAALREIEFDRATGKLSESDYADLKQRYTRAALDEMRANERQASASPDVAVDANGTLPIDDAVEAAIERARASQRSCDVCGPRPEFDAVYCSSCGRYLPHNCGTCGAAVDLVGSRFCSSCGTQLAAA